ncbi:MAG: hypothetical protein IJR26_00310 [Bacteroidales bacterium]|nr:hypothetical protein [Bacteroidales bacterium]
MKAYLQALNPRRGFRSIYNDRTWLSIFVYTLAKLGSFASYMAKLGSFASYLAKLGSFASYPRRGFRTVANAHHPHQSLSP